MEINDKKIKRTGKIINFLISSVLAIFLILLSNSIIYDLDNAGSRPMQSEYTDVKTNRELNQVDTQLRDEEKILRDQYNNLRKMYRVAIEVKDSEQESFDNWIKTRSTLGNANQDTEVLSRVKKLDDLLKTAQQWNAKADSVNTLIDDLNTRISNNQELSSVSWSKSNLQYEKAVSKYDLRIFLIRLLFVAPILALGIFFLLKKRRHKFSPLFMGFSLFSIYIFFFGLVPYLPSFGGYIRYTVGVLLTLALGYYAIKRLRAYSEQKQAELKQSSTQRATRLETDITEKAFNNHICPSCGKDFLLKSWERVTDIDTKTLRPISSYCRYCGMQLFKKCSKCQQENYAHLPFCTGCGVRINKEQDDTTESNEE